MTRHGCARSHDPRGRCAGGSATRPTSPWPPSSPTCARPRRRPRPSSSSLMPARTSSGPSARGAEGPLGGAGAPSPADGAWTSRGASSIVARRRCASRCGANGWTRRAARSIARSPGRCPPAERARFRCSGGSSRSRPSLCWAAATRLSKARTATCAPRSRIWPRATACGCACVTDERRPSWRLWSEMAEPEVSLDKALERLEAIADKLEDPALDLDDAVRLYEEGLRLYAECAKRLDAADLRITQLADALAKQARRE